MSTQERQYLGLVTRLPPKRDARYHFATVQPLVQSDEEGIKWQGPVTDAKVQFPKRGLLHWHVAPVDVELGSIWQFVVEEIPKAESAGHPEAFQLLHAVAPIEVIDLRGSDDEAALRSAATSGGFDLTPPPIARRFLLWLSSGLCVGPLTLKRTEGQLWTIDAPEGLRDAARMPAHRIPADQITQVNVDGLRWVLAPGHELGQSAGIQNWSPDTEVARSILRRLRKMDRPAADALKVVDRVFSEYLDRVEAAGLTGVDLALERARADRLRGVRAAIKGNADLLLEAAQALLQTDDVRKALDREIEEYRKRLFEAIGREVEEAFAAKKAELAILDASIASRQKRLAELDDEVRAKVAAFDEEVSRRLREIAKRPEALFAELSVLRAALLDTTRATNSSIDTSTLTSAPPDPVERLPTFERGTALSTEEDVKAELGRRTVNAGLSPYAALNLHAVFLAGTVPVIVGEHAYDILRLYAGAIAAGRLNWVPVGSSLLEPIDLLGRFDSSMRRIVPHPAGVLDSIRDATGAARLHIVALDGFNRAPVDGYLLPILEAAAAARQGDSTRSIPLVNAAVVSEDDPYRQMQRVVWPPNVLVACIPSHGSATLPIAAEMWRFFTVVDADGRALPPLGIGTGVAPAAELSAPTEIGLELWRSLLTSAVGTTKDAALTALRRLATEWKLSNSDAVTAHSVYLILRRQALSHEDALGTAVTSCLVPRTSVAAKSLEGSLRSLGKAAVGNWQMIYDEADRLRN